MPKLRHVTTNMGVTLADEEVDEMVNKATMNGDGKINLEASTGGATGAVAQAMADERSFSRAVAA